MIKQDNVRLTFTFSKKQAKWIETTAKKLKMNKSKFIRWLISNNLHKILAGLPDKDLDEIIRIAKTPWINDEVDDYE